MDFTGYLLSTAFGSKLPKVKQPSFFAEQLTLYQPGGQIMPTTNYKLHEFSDLTIALFIYSVKTK